MKNKVLDNKEIEQFHNHINVKLKKIGNKHSLKNPMLLYPKFVESNFLTISCNPTPCKNQNISTYEDSFKAECFARDTRNSNNRHFKAIYSFFDNKPVNCIDLFPIRYSNQDEVMSIIGCKKGAIRYKEDITRFGRDMVMLAKYIIEKLSPKVIYVLSAGIRDIIKQAYGNAMIDDIRGFSILTLNNKKMLVYFSSALSGSHVIDNGLLPLIKYHVLNDYLLIFKKHSDDKKDGNSLDS